jgi:hypothetical protein
MRGKERKAVQRMRDGGPLVLGSHTEVPESGPLGGVRIPRWSQARRPGACGELLGFFFFFQY